MVATDAASPLAMAVSELVHNAVEHAGAHTICVEPSRSDGRIGVTVRDDGAGMGLTSVEGLGLQIVRTLIEEDLHGECEITSPAGGGCVISVSLPWND